MRKNTTQLLIFVQYMSSPEIQLRLAEELCRIPLANTVELPEKLAGFKITEEPLRMAWYTGINEKLRNYFHRAGQDISLIPSPWMSLQRP